MKIFKNKSYHAALYLIGAGLLVIALIAYHEHASRQQSKKPQSHELWGTYETPDIALTYPAELNNFRLEEEYQRIVGKFDYDQNYYGDKAPFEIELIPIGYSLITDPFGGRSDIFATPINIAESKGYLEDNYNTMDKVIGYRKLSDKSVVVVRYGDYECSPSWSIEIIAPIQNSKKYSNIIVKSNVISERISKDQGEDGECSFKGDVQRLADRIAEGNAKEQTMQNIQRAQIIAESVRVKN